MIVLDQRGGELLRLVGGRAVANREQGHAVLADGGEHARGGRLARAVALRDLQHAVVEHAARRVDDGHLAAVAVAGVEAHDRVARERRLQQELAQVDAEEVDGVLLGFFRQRGADLARQGRQQQALVAVLDGELQVLRPDGRRAVQLALDAPAVVLVVRRERDLEAAELLAAVDGEDAVRRQAVDGFLVGLVHAEDLLAFLGRIFGELRLQAARLRDVLAHGLADLRLLHDGLGHDVHRPLQRVLSRRDVLVFLAEGRRNRFRAALLVAREQHAVCERLEAALAGNLRARALLLLVGQVEVFEFLQFARLLDGPAQVIRQLALLLDFGEDFFLPLDEAAQVRETLLELAQLLVLERSRRLLAVARDERHGIAFVEQLGSCLDLMRLHLELRRNLRIYVFFQHRNTSFSKIQY